MATDRNRVIYQSEALFVGDIGANAHSTLASSNQLLRVQDISHGVELNRVDVNEFGQLAAIERKIVEPPTVSLDFSYYIHGGRNEKLLGLIPTESRADGNTADLKQALSGWLIGDEGKNYYISVVGEGDDNAPITKGNQTGVIGIGNGYVTSFNVEAAVGDIPSSSVSVEANNLQFSTSAQDIENPAVDLESGASVGGAALPKMPQASDTGSISAGTDNAVACLRPGDIYVNFNDKGECKPADDAGGAAVGASSTATVNKTDAVFNSFPIDATLTIQLKAGGSFVLTAKDSENLGQKQFKRLGTNAETATSIAAVINHVANTSKLTAVASDDSVEITQVDVGPFTGTVVCSSPLEMTTEAFADGALASTSVGADPEVQMGGAILEGTGQCHLQNFTMDVPVARTPLQRLGNTFPYAREVDVPMNITLSCSALLGDLDAGSLNDLLCGSDKKRHIRIIMRAPCSDHAAEEGDVVMEYLIKGAQLDSQNFSATIGDNKTVDMVFTAQLAGANGTSSGLFFWADTNAAADDGVTVANPQ